MKPITPVEKEREREKKMSIGVEKSLVIDRATNEKHFVAFASSNISAKPV